MAGHHTVDLLDFKVIVTISKLGHCSAWGVVSNYVYCRNESDLQVYKRKHV